MFFAEECSDIGGVHRTGMIVVHDLFDTHGEIFPVTLLNTIVVTLMKENCAGIGFARHLGLVHCFKNSAAVKDRAGSGRFVGKGDLLRRILSAAINISVLGAGEEGLIFEAAGDFGRESAEVCLIALGAVGKLRGSAEQMRTENIEIFQIQNRMLERCVKKCVGTAQ